MEARCGGAGASARSLRASNASSGKAASARSGSLDTRSCTTPVSSSSVSTPLGCAPFGASSPSSGSCERLSASVPTSFACNDFELERPPYLSRKRVRRAGQPGRMDQRARRRREAPLEIRLTSSHGSPMHLAAAHSVGIPHKDLKPANVLIREAEDGTPVLPFGFWNWRAHRPRKTRRASDHCGGNDRTRSIRPPSGTCRYANLCAARELERIAAHHPRRHLRARCDPLRARRRRPEIDPSPRAGERSVHDPILRSDIAVMIDGDPARRLSRRPGSCRAHPRPAA